MISSSPKTLTVVIPALNEQSAIGDTVSRCLAATESICNHAGLASIEWIVVSDGSTDRTVEIAKGFPAIHVVDWARNRGYGAAIQHGFEIGSGDLLAFLDADGTCDPNCFGEMCRQILDEGAELTIGSRMTAESHMPRIRRVGNWLYAFLLGCLTGRSVTDAASGMRVLTREAFLQLRPLPSGLHFTPAMSAKALSTDMRVTEIPIPYAERIGESKLHVVRDGFRFLSAILGGMLSVRPDRLLGLILAVCLVVTGAIAAFPIEYYWQHRSLEPWMIYRFFACYVLGHAGFTSLAAVGISHRLASFGPQRKPTDSFLSSLAAKFFEIRSLGCWGGACLLVSFLLIRSGLYEFITRGTVDLHWSRMFVSAFLMTIVFQGVVTSVLLRVIEMWVDAHQRGASTTARKQR